MTARRLVRLGLFLAVVGLLAASVPNAALAAGNNVGANLGNLLKHYAGEIYGGIIAIVSVIFLLNRRYSELMVFLLAAVVVAWMVFSPDQIADTARAIGQKILGG